MEKKTDNLPKDLKSSEATINEIMETFGTNENKTDSKESTHEPPNEEYVMNLFKQYSSFTPPTLV